MRVLFQYQEDMSVTLRRVVSFHKNITGASEHLLQSWAGAFTKKWQTVVELKNSGLPQDYNLSNILHSNSVLTNTNTVNTIYCR